MTGCTFTVRAEWDEAAAVWIATSDDVPGLCAEADTFDELVECVVELVPELLLANEVFEADELAEVPVRVLAERQTVVRRAA
jgi:predicted RNase H-like HicB family nuclease